MRNKSIPNYESQLANYSVDTYVSHLYSLTHGRVREKNINLVIDRHMLFCSAIAQSLRLKQQQHLIETFSHTLAQN